ncbi:MAG: type-F conjugative transfer system pilin assembly protein TrbC [Gammaproteobacteria bacterium]|nr:type-F conjugative transfer system pilin assembly protein TrbC [Gammaproteobacteria bacterium]
MKKIILFFCLCMTIVCDANAQAVIQNNNAMLFVSLSMPKLALRQYVIQSNLYHIPLILRGFLQNNYPETAKRIYSILHPKNSNAKAIPGGFEIDPLYFRKFHINAVPALVIHKQGHYTVVYGNIPISKMLTLIAENSKNILIKNQARNYLENNDAK